MLICVSLQSRPQSPPEGPDSLTRLIKQADPDEMASVYNELARSCLDQKPDKALKYADSAIYLAGINQQDTEIARALITKAEALVSIGENEMALEAIDDATVILEKPGGEGLLPDALDIAGNIRKELNDYAGALNSFLRELSIEQARDDSTGMLDATKDIAFTYHLWEKYDSALVYYHSSLKYAKLLGDRKSEANIINNMGNIYLSWSNYQKSLDHYLEALDICREIGDSVGISKAYNNIGIIYFDWKEWDKSLEYYRYSFEVDSMMHNVIGQAQTLNNIAIIYDETGEDEKALRVYERSLALARKARDHYQIAVTTSNIGGFMVEEKQFDKAEQYYEETLKNYRLANSIIGVTETELLMGDLYKEKGDPGKALGYYKRCLDIVMPMKLYTAILNAYKSMSSAYRELGDYRNAYKYNDRYHRIKDSIFNIEISNQLASLTNPYEIEKREKEMELQEVRMSEQRSQIRRQQIVMAGLAAMILMIAIFSVLLIRQYRLRMKAWGKLLEQHEEILQNRQELIKAKEKAEESDRLKSTFLVNVSHELRTPMNGIMGFTDLLRKGSVPDDQQQLYLSYISSSSRQLLRVLNDIIDISSIETKMLKLEIGICEPHNIFNDLHDFFSKELAEAEKSNIRITYTPPPDAGKHRCKADKKRLAQIVFNLLNNAVRFTTEGSISFGYEVIDNRVMKIYVSDTGIGIERSNHELIFERFRQVDDSTTRQHGGSGLGLAICRELVTLMDGKIYLESSVGQGSTFYVELPYEKA
jgi:signal transduction histidine kinase